MPLLVVNQIGHTGSIGEVVHTPDGRKVLSASADGTVRVWDAATGALILTFDVHPSAVTSLVVTPDGRRAVSGCSKGQVLIWDVATGKVLRELDGTDWVGSLAISADGKQLITGSRGRATLWDLKSGKALRIHHTDGHPVDAVGFTPRGPFAVWDRGLRVYVRDLERGRMAYTKQLPNKCHVARILFSPDAKTLVIGTWHDHAIRLYESATGKLIRELEGQRYEIADVTFSPDRRQLVSCGRDQTIHFWELATGRRRHEFSLSPKVIKWAAVDYAPDGQTFIAANQQNENPAQLRRFDASTGELVATFTGGQWIPKGVGLSDDGRRAVIGVRDDSMLVWDVQRAEAERVLLPGEWDSGLTAVAMSRDGKRAAAAMSDYAYFWDLNSGQSTSQPLGKAGRFEVTGGGYQVNRITGFSIRSLDISADGRRVAASGHGGRVRVWDFETGRVELSIDETLGDLQLAYGFASLLTPGGKLLWGVDGHKRRKLALTDIASGRELRTYPSGLGRPVAVSPDSRSVLSLSESRLRLYDLSSARMTCDFGSGYRRGVFDAHGAWVFAVRGDSTLSVLDVRRCKRERVLRAPTGRLTTVAVASQAGRVLTGDTNGSARLWDLSSGQSMSITASGEDWLIYTDDGFFDASRNGGDLVAFVQEGRALRAEQVAALYNRPDVVLERMRLGDSRTRAEYRALYRNRVRRLDLPAVVGALSQAPTVSILELSHRGRRARVVFEARAQHGELSRADVLVNEVPVTSAQGLQASGRQQRFELEVDLVPGTNRVEVTAIDGAGVQSLRAFRTIEVKPTVPALPRLYYLGFAVSRYARAEYNLAYAHKDALDLALVFQAMQGKFSEVKIATFLDEYATRQNLAAAKRLLADARPEDLLVVFVAGHGLHTDDFYFLTHEADLTRLAETAVRFSEIEDLVTDVGPRNKLLLIDTCHSGDLQEDQLPAEAMLAGSAGARPRVARALILDRRRARLQAPSMLLADGERLIHRRLLIRHGASVLSASRGNELSYEMTELKNGAFTKALLRALTTREGDANGDGLLDIDELRRSVTHRVQQSTGFHQHPTMRQENRSARLLLPIVEYAQSVLTRPENVGASRVVPPGYAPYRGPLPALALEGSGEPGGSAACSEQVEPGPRGCSCRVGASPSRRGAPWAWLWAGLLCAARCWRVVRRIRACARS